MQLSCPASSWSKRKRMTLSLHLASDIWTLAFPTPWGRISRSLSRWSRFLLPKGHPHPQGWGCHILDIYTWFDPIYLFFLFLISPPPFMPLGSSGLPSFFLAIWVSALLHQQAPHLHYLNQSQNCGSGGRVRLSLLAWETSWHEDYLRLLRNFSSTLFICNWHSLSTDFGVE